MNKKVQLAIIILFTVTLGFKADVYGQLLINENFDYIAGTQLVANGWAQTGTVVTNPILVSNGGLSYTGYQSSGIGNAISLITTGQDANLGFAQQTSGTVYAGFLVSVASAQTLGDYFIHFIQAPLSGNTFKGRVFVKKDASSSAIAFGISKSSTSSTTVNYTGFSYALNTTYFVVLKYRFIDGSLNDEVALYINPAIGAAEPVSPDVSYIDITLADATNLGYIGLRQGSPGSAAVVQADGLRIGQTWADVAGSAPVPTLSQWGLILLGFALLGVGSIYILRSRG